MTNDDHNKTNYIVEKILIELRLQTHLYITQVRKKEIKNEKVNTKDICQMVMLDRKGNRHKFHK